MSEFKKYGHGDVIEVPMLWNGGWSFECVMCNRKIQNKETAFEIHFVDGDSKIWSASVEGYVEDGGDMGYWYVGKSCADKFEDGVLFKGKAIQKERYGSY